MEIKTTMRYHLTAVRMAIINKSQNAGEGVARREPYYTVGRNINCYRFLKKLKNIITI